MVVMHVVRSGWILKNIQKGKPIGFPDSMNVGVRKRGVKNGLVFFFA